MTKVRRTIFILLVFTILCSLFVVVFAVGALDTEDGVLPPAVNAYEYAKAPEGVYVFRYYGSDPYADLDIDTSECVVDRLYVYHSEADSVVEIIAEEVSDYSCTQTALYYVTEEQKVYKTDYTGTNHEYLYQCSQGTISMLSSYYDALYFIEAQTRIIYLDTTSKVAQEIWAYEYLDWVFMLNDTQLIATTPEEEDYLYDISTDTATHVSSIVAANMVTAAIKGTPSNNARSSTNPTASYANVTPTQENDVTFPLTEYWADPDGCYETSAPYRSEPDSWFHINGQEGCGNNDVNCKRYSGSGECKGFAKYVHDVYAHMVHDTSYDSNGNKIANDRADELWEARTCIVTHSWMEDATDFDSSTLRLWSSNTSNDITDIQRFFESLNTGAYVRYGKYRADDSSPDDGCHSIVFIDSDADGIWVYECNQDYDPNSSNDGCGVFIQYYPYNRLFRYKYIRKYVNHDFAEAPVYDDAAYHKVGCTDCVGYLRQAHDGTATFVSTTQHDAVYTCCPNNSGRKEHTGTVTYKKYSTTQHKITSTCCDGFVLGLHNFRQGSSGSYICTGCGADRDASSGVLKLE